MTVIRRLVAAPILALLMVVAGIIAASGSAHAASSGIVTGSTANGGSQSNCIALASGQYGEINPQNVSAAQSLTGATFNCLNTFANPSSTWADWVQPWQFGNDDSTAPSDQTSTYQTWAYWLASNPAHQMSLGLDLVPWEATGGTGAPVANPLTWEQACAAGQYDSHATQLAQNLVADGAFAHQALVIRLGIEANGNWEADWVGSSSAEATAWGQCYQHEVAAMRAVPGTNFLFVWNANACYSSGVSDLSWYPGNASVDIIAADDYDTDCTNQATVASEGFSAYASAGSPSLNSLRSFAATNGKPFALPEWGLSTGNDDAAYVNGLSGELNGSSTGWAYQAYFDTGTDGVPQLSSSYPNAVAAYQADFGGGSQPPPQNPPAVTTTAASNVTTSGATLNGTVNPNGADASYHFQYGTSTSYGSVTTTGDAGSGSSAVNESASISGLQSSTTYHYRLVASNSGGTTNGSDQTFTTGSSQQSPPVLSAGHATANAPTRETVTWQSTVTPGQWRCTILGPNFNNVSNVVSVESAVYSGLTYGHTYTVTVQQLDANGANWGNPGKIVFVAGQ
jgi:hypothetical protein